MQPMPEHMSWHAISPPGKALVCTFTYSWDALSRLSRLAASTGELAAAVELARVTSVVMVPAAATMLILAIIIIMIG